VRRRPRAPRRRSARPSVGGHYRTLAQAKLFSRLQLEPVQPGGGDQSQRRMLRASQQNAVLVTPAVVFGWLGLSYPAHRIELWIAAALLFSGAFLNLVRVVRMNRRSSDTP